MAAILIVQECHPQFFIKQNINCSLSLAEGKIPPDEPPILPPIPVVGRDDKRRPGFSTPQATKKFREREWDRERGMDFDLMPPPGSNKKTTTTMDVDQTIDPNEPTYCICHQVSFEVNIYYNICGTYIYFNIYIKHFFSQFFAEKRFLFLIDIPGFIW